MNKATLILVVIVILGLVNLVSLGQPANLTDRELLIQLHGKIEFIEESVKRIENNSSNVNERISFLDKQVSRNEMNIAGFYDKLGDLISRWNYLLGLFATFIIGIFIWMWRRTYNDKAPTKSGK